MIPDGNQLIHGGAHLIGPTVPKPILPSVWIDMDPLIRRSFKPFGCPQLHRDRCTVLLGVELCQPHRNRILIDSH
jgi:hypothetical protein